MIGAKMFRYSQKLIIRHKFHMEKYVHALQSRLSLKTKETSIINFILCNESNYNQTKTTFKSIYLTIKDTRIENKNYLLFYKMVLKN